MVWMSTSIIRCLLRNYYVEELNRGNQTINCAVAVYLEL